MDKNQEKQLVATESCGFGKFRISVIHHVDSCTRYCDDGSPKDGYATSLNVELDSPDIGTTVISTYELLKGDFRKLADMFTKLAIMEEERGRL